jgi:hypothetical protein
MGRTSMGWRGKEFGRRTNPSVYITPVESFVFPRKQDPTSETYGCSK